MRSVFSKNDLVLAKAKGLRTLGLEAKDTDDLPSQIAKNIPVEVVTLYTGIFGLIKSRTDLLTTNNLPTDSVTQSAGLLALILGIVGTILYGYWRNRKDAVPNAAIKVGLALIAFLIWAYTLGQPFANYGWYDAFWGGVLLIIYLFLSPLAYEMVTTIQIRQIYKK